MSLSVGGFECGYGYPGTMGLSSASAQGYYGVHYPPDIQAYQDYSERDLYNSWVLSAAGSAEMSPDSYGSVSGTPSPTAASQYGYSVTDTMQHMSHWRDFQMTDGELALAHNIPVSDLGQYESYTNVYGDRCLRRRTSANRKERRRTLSINNAFSNLRGSIPNVPSDTKLSKIKTLRLAISYISYLTEILEKGDSELAQNGFKADISRKRERRVIPTEKDKKLPDSCVSTYLYTNIFMHSYKYFELYQSCKSLATSCLYAFYFFAGQDKMFLVIISLLIFFVNSRTQILGGGILFKDI